MPREDFTHKMVNGQRIELSSLEVDSLVQAENDWAAGAAARAWASLRLRRDQKLKDTDHYGLSDVPLSDEMKLYRKQLRDLPSTLDDTTVQGEITWPSEPS
jgi:hypothetical protein